MGFLRFSSFSIFFCKFMGGSWVVCGGDVMNGLGLGVGLRCGKKSGSYQNTYGCPRREGGRDALEGDAGFECRRWGLK